MAATYSIEVWHKDGYVLGDISSFVTDFSWQKTLNDSETLNVSIDMARFGQYLSDIGYANRPYEFLEIGRTDIRIKRNGVYILGANVAQIGYTANNTSVTMAIQCYGYLTYYKYRYYSGSYTQWNQADILNDVIIQCNAKQGGDYGVTRGDTFGADTKRDRTYDLKEVKSLFTQMSEVLNGVDFQFTPDKKLNIWNTAEACKGVYRPDVVLEYPLNIKGFSFYRTGSNVSNHVIAVGKTPTDGDKPIVEVSDTSSEDYLYRREKMVTYNSVSDVNTLTQHANAVLYYTKDIIEIPNITVGDDVLDLSELDVGDTITVKMNGDVALSDINGDYRIKSIQCRVDQNFGEEVTLRFDDIDINEIIQKQQEAA